MENTNEAQRIYSLIRQLQYRHLPLDGFRLKVSPDVMWRLKAELRREIQVTVVTNDGMETVFGIPIDIDANYEFNTIKLVLELEE